MDNADSRRLEYPVLPGGDILRRRGCDMALGALVKAPVEHLWVFFFLFLVSNLALISRLAYLGVRLLKGDEKAILRTSTVLFAEIVSFCSNMWVFWIWLPKYVAVFTSSGDLLAPQVVTGYVAIGLVVITLVLALAIRWKVRTSSIATS